VVLVLAVIVAVVIYVVCSVGDTDGTYGEISVARVVDFGVVINSEVVLAVAVLVAFVIFVVC
jgi:hypothetical protein